MSSLDREQEVVRLASELGLDWRTPVESVVAFCRSRIDSWVQEVGGIESLMHLEQLVASKLQLVFEEVWSNEELEQLIEKYVALGEPVVVSLRDGFDEQTYAVLIERRNLSVEPRSRYVAVIDCRGSKYHRRYFSRWHEIAHLLTLTRQLELPLHRSNDRDPVERLMDAIAGSVGFYDPIFAPALQASLRSHGGDLSFSTVDDVRSAICPQASFQATLSACVDRTPTPVIYLEAGLGLTKREQSLANKSQGYLFGRSNPRRKLRVLVVVPNQAAKERRLRINWNMRVPVYSAVYCELLATGKCGGDCGDRKSAEDLGLWSHSDGTALPSANVRVDARCVGDRAIALIRPT